MKNLHRKGAKTNCKKTTGEVVMPFDPKRIDKHFKNISIRPYHVGELFCLYGYEGDIADIHYIKGSWHIIIDNFPGQRKHYHTDFPIKSVDEFIFEMKRINLNFEKA